jgi:hypothetical protein
MWFRAAYQDLKEKNFLIDVAQEDMEFNTPITPEELVEPDSGAYLSTEEIEKYSLLYSGPSNIVLNDIVKEPIPLTVEERAYRYCIDKVDTSSNGSLRDIIATELYRLRMWIDGLSQLTAHVISSEWDTSEDLMESIEVRKERYGFIFYKKGNHWRFFRSPFKRDFYRKSTSSSTMRGIDLIFQYPMIRYWEDIPNDNFVYKGIWYCSDGSTWLNGLTEIPQWDNVFPREIKKLNLRVEGKVSSLIL